MTEITVTQALSYAIGIAWMNQSDVRKRWIRISHYIGSKLPHSMLMLSIQRLGRFDMLIREMEKEFIPEKIHSIGTNIYAIEALPSFSENWVCNAYEIFRTLDEREFITGKEFDAIYNDLRLIRIPLEKHQLAKDNNLRNREQPLELESFPSYKTIAPAKRYIYPNEKADRKKRSHIMPTGISPNGSWMWYVLDLEDPNNIQEYWIERLNLSDRIIELWSE